MSGWNLVEWLAWFVYFWRSFRWIAWPRTVAWSWKRTEWPSWVCGRVRWKRSSFCRTPRRWSRVVEQPSRRARRRCSTVATPTSGRRLPTGRARSTVANAWWPWRPVSVPVQQIWLHLVFCDVLCRNPALRYESFWAGFYCYLFRPENSGSYR